MANINQDRINFFVVNLMRLLEQNPDGLRAKEAIKQLQQIVSPNEFELGLYSDGSTRFDKLVRFATISPVKAGWMIKERGYWFITSDGEQALKDFPDPSEFVRTAKRPYREWRKASLLVEEFEDDAAEAIEESLENTTLDDALESAQGDSWVQIESHISKMDPYQFQKLVAALLEGMEYHVSWVSPPGRDGGVDIIAFTDPLGATGPRIKVQVKRWSGKTDSDGLKSFLSLLDTNDIGVFVCTGGFTKDAEMHARQQEVRRITLLDSYQFFNLWVEHYSRIPESKRNLLPLVPVHFLDQNALS